MVRYTSTYVLLEESAEALSSHYAFWLPKPPCPHDPVYIVLMNKTKTNSMSNQFRLSFDFCTEGYANVWEAMGATLAGSVQSADAIVRVEYTGEAPNGWPMLEVTFATIECAKAFTYAYLGYTLDNSSEWDVYTDDEVSEYISHGEFV